MNAILLRDAGVARFVLVEVEAALQPAAEALEFTRGADGFERRFPLREDVEDVFRRFETSIESMLRQHAGLEPVPWEGALRRLVRVLNGDVDWCLVGSAVLACRGIAVEPRDIDVVVRAEDFVRVTERLADDLVEPVVEAGDWVARWFARAFLGARLECIAGVQDWVDASAPSDFGPHAWERRERIAWDGRTIQVPPLDLQLAAARRRGLVDRVRVIERFMAADGA